MFRSVRNLPIANTTAATFTIPANTRKIGFQVRTSAAVQYSWTSEAAAQNGPFMTLKADGAYEEELNSVGNDSNNKLYFYNVSGGAIVVEFETHG